MSPNATQNAFQTREHALRQMRQLLERMRNQLQQLSKKNRQERKRWKKIKRSRGHLKQAFYEVTLADQKTWQKVQSRIIRTYQRAKHVLETS